MKLYIAGASAELETCERLRDGAIAAGHTITHDWMADVRAHLGTPDGELHLIDSVTRAAFCIDGVRRCDTFWLVSPEFESIGCWVELGYAIGAQMRTNAVRPVIVVTGKWRSIFGDLGDRHYPTHDEFLEALRSGGAS